jgi:protein SCO1
VKFPPLQLRLALVEAGEGKTGSFLEKVILTCYQYDPATRRYGPYIFGFLRIGGLAILLAFAAVMWHFWRRELKRDD